MSLSVNDLYGSLGASSIGADTVSGMASAGKLTNTIEGAQTEDEMMSACEEFEVYLLQKMFQTMEESAKVFSDEEEEGNDYVDMFSDQMYQGLAETMVESGSGLGIAKTLYESMIRNSGATIPAQQTAEQSAAGQAADARISAAQKAAAMVTAGQE